MAFRKDPPAIPMHLIQWQDTGDETNPKARLLAHIRIGDVDMHLEAWEVFEVPEIGQCAVGASMRDDDHAALCDMMGGAFTTTEIDGRSYVLVATPYCP